MRIGVVGGAFDGSLLWMGGLVGKIGAGVKSDIHILMVMEFSCNNVAKMLTWLGVNTAGAQWPGT